MSLTTLSALQPAWAQCRRQALEIPVKLVNHRPIVMLTVEGVELPMLLDSGAFHSLLMPSTAARLKLPLSRLPNELKVWGHTGRIEAKLTKVREVEFQGLKLKDVEFIVGGSELGSEIQGILGRNFLRFSDVEYDLGQGRIRLMFAKGECDDVHPVYWAHEVPVIEAPLESWQQDGRLGLKTRINGRKITAMLDTGAPRTGLSLKAALRVGVERSELVPNGRTGGADAGSAASWTAPIRSFELGGQTVENLRISVDEVAGREQDMLLGLDYFLAHRIYISRARQTLYATWNGGPIFSSGPLERDGDAGAGALPAEAPAADDVEALARQAAATATRGDLARALEQFSRVIELAPQNAEHRLSRARVLISLRQGSQALRDLDEALRLDAGLSAARLLRAGLVQRRDQGAGTLADLQVLDQQLPADAHLRYEMAELYARLGRLPEALRQWALWMPNRAHDRRLASALNGRCWLRARMRQQLPEALQDCEAAVAADRGIAAYQDSLGWTLLQLGEPDRALKAFDRAIALDARHAWSHYGRSLARRRLSDMTGAQADLETARRLRPRIDAEVVEAGFEASADGRSEASAADPAR